MRLAPILALALTLIPPRAAPFRVYGAGAQLCASWTAAGPTERIDRQSWLLGFVSGAGYGLADDLAESDAAALIAAVDRTCRAEPAKPIHAAAADVVAALRAH